MDLDGLHAFSSEQASRLCSEWGFLQLCAVLAATGCLLWRAPTRQRHLALCLAAALPGALLGAVLLDPVLRAPAWLLTGARGPMPLPRGIAAYGALAGLVGTYAALARLRGERAGAALDLVAPSLGVLVALSRVGCFRAGCDFGAPSSLPWAVHYPAMTPAFAMHREAGWIAADAAGSLGVHPTQLYEAVLGVSMVAVALLASRTRSSRARPGSVFASVAVVYAAGRSLLEPLRGDVARGAFGATTAQWLGFVVIALVIVAFARAPRVREEPPDMADSHPLRRSLHRSRRYPEGRA